MRSVEIELCRPRMLRSKTAALGSSAARASTVHRHLFTDDERNNLHTPNTMSGIGPALPPHLLAKRKRQQEDALEDAPITASGAKRSPSPTEGEKRRRTIGPALPPAPLEERPAEPASAAQESDSEDDDGFGPSLPPVGTDKNRDDDDSIGHAARAASPVAPEKLRRDDWMMMPPEQDDLAARMDPTKIRARGFNTGKGAKGPKASGGDSSAWNETPEQRQKRLQEEVMGIAKTASPGPQSSGISARSAREEAEAARTREQIVSPYYHPICLLPALSKSVALLRFRAEEV